MKKIFLLFTIQIILSVLSLNAQDKWQWVKTAGSPESGAFDIATDLSGNIYTVGRFTDATIDFEGTMLTNHLSGNADIFVAKYNSDGNVIWVKSFGGTDNDYAYSLSVDKNENIFITGTYISSNIQMDGSIVITGGTGTTDLFVMKLKSDGSFAWGSSAGGTGLEYGRAITVDKDGNPIFVGDFSSSSITLEGTTLNSNGGSDMVVAKFNSVTGALIWAKSAGGTGGEQFADIKTDSNGNIYIAGGYSSPSLAFGVSNLINPESNLDILMLKMDPDGNELWAKTKTGTSLEQANAIGIDSNDNAYFGCYKTEWTGIGTDWFNGSNAYIYKFNNSGTEIWERKFGYDSGTYIRDIHINADNELYVSGEFMGNKIDFPSGTITNTVNGKYDLFFAKYDENGNNIWAGKIGGTDQDYMGAATANACGQFYVTGQSSSHWMKFGDFWFENTDSPDTHMYLAKFSYEMQIDANVTDAGLSGSVGAVNISVSEGYPTYSYLWSPGGETSKDLNSLSPNKYTIEVTDDRGCKKTKSIKIDLPCSDNHYSIWYFGFHAGLDFYRDNVDMLNNGNNEAIEGGASICDINGNMIFYTDGTTVWDRNHKAMPNGQGLYGHGSSTQSAVIIPKPLSSNLYYIFTTDWYQGSNGLCYSIVDMNANGGLGDIITKNTGLNWNVTEKLTAIKHSNGKDYQIFAHEENKNIVVYTLSETGVSLLNTQSVGANLGNPAGQMKVSPKADKIVCANYEFSLQIFDYNMTSGAIAISVSKELATERYYGAEFSPSGRFLYITAYSDPYAENKILQFDLEAGTPADILASETVIYSENTTTTDYFKSMQIAPNGKIYITRSGLYLAEIAKPDKKGLDCMFTKEAITFSGASARSGLPQNPAKNSMPIITGTATDALSGSDGSIDISISNGVLPYNPINWSPGGQTTEDISGLSAGNYIVNVTDAKGCKQTKQFEISGTISDCQNYQFNNWYFGEFAGITFSTADAEPEKLENSSMNGFEGCASVSDRAGNLLFYTDGATVWNKNHAIMDNGTGLGSSNSAAQSALIVPLENDIYYIFTADSRENNGANGLQYNIVDMNLNAGVGKITSKNNQLLSPSAEKLAGTHAKDGSIWIVSMPNNEAKIYAYKVSLAGVVSAPVISDLTSVFTDNNYGTIKISQNGKLISIANSDDNLVELAEFDNETGVVANPMQITGFTDTYDTEFSPDASKLYVTDNQQELFQFDLNDYNSGAISTSKKSVAFKSVINGGINALQVAPNGKIYISSWNSTLGVINQPNYSEALLYQLDMNAIDLGTGHAVIGLPNVIVSFFRKVDFSFENLCHGSETQFTLLSNENDIQTFAWEFEEIVPPSYIHEENPKYTFPTSGNKNVKLHITSNCFDDYTVEKTVPIQALPPANAGEDKRLCYGETMFLGDEIIPDCVNYRWVNDTDGLESPNSSYTKVNFVNNTANPIVKTYTYEAVAACSKNCPNTDEIQITFYPKIDTEFSGIETSYCKECTSGGEAYSVSLTPKIAGGSFSLNGNSLPGNTFNLCGDAGNHANTGSNSVKYEYTDANNCIASTTKVFNLSNTFSVGLGKDTSICTGSVLVLDAGTGYDSYLWENNNSTNQTIKITQNGTYNVEVKQGECSGKGSIKVDTYSIDVSIGNDTTICKGESITLAPEKNFITYNWQNGLSSEKLLSVNSEGSYILEVTDEKSCTASDTIEITEIDFEISLGSDQEYCEGETVLLSLEKGDKYLWNTGETSNEIKINKPGEYSVTANFQNCKSSDTVNINFTKKPDIVYDQEFICKGSYYVIGEYSESENPFNLEIETISPDAYFTTEQYFDYRENRLYGQGRYKITASNKCGSDTDTLLVAHYHIPDMEMPGDTSFCPGEVLTLIASEGFQYYLWNTGDTDNLIHISDAGIYVLEVKDENCVYKDTTIVSYSENCETSEFEIPIFIPEGFSPNGDGKNDVFDIVGLDEYLDNEIIIINRWGNKVFEASPYKSNWDGTNMYKNNAPLPASTYYFILKITDNGNEKVFKGSVFFGR